MIIAVVALAAWLGRRTRNRHAPPLVVGVRTEPTETTTGILLTIALLWLTAGLVFAGTGLRPAGEAAAIDRRPSGETITDLDAVLGGRT